MGWDLGSIIESNIHGLEESLKNEAKGIEGSVKSNAEGLEGSLKSNIDGLAGTIRTNAVGLWNSALDGIGQLAGAIGTGIANILKPNMLFLLMAIGVGILIWRLTEEGSPGTETEADGDSPSKPIQSKRGVSNGRRNRSRANHRRNGPNRSNSNRSGARRGSSQRRSH